MNVNDFLDGLTYTNTNLREDRPMPNGLYTLAISNDDDYDNEYLFGVWDNPESPNLLAADLEAILVQSGRSWNTWNHTASVLYIGPAKAAAGLIEELTDDTWEVE